MGSPLIFSKFIAEHIDLHPTSHSESFQLHLIEKDPLNFQSLKSLLHTSLVPLSSNQPTDSHPSSSESSQCPDQINLDDTLTFGLSPLPSASSSTDTHLTSALIELHHDTYLNVLPILMNTPASDWFLFLDPFNYEGLDLDVIRGCFLHPNMTMVIHFVAQSVTSMVKAKAQPSPKQIKRLCQLLGPQLTVDRLRLILPKSNIDANKQILVFFMQSIRTAIESTRASSTSQSDMPVTPLSMHAKALRNGKSFMIVITTKPSYHLRFQEHQTDLEELDDICF